MLLHALAALVLVPVASANGIDSRARQDAIEEAAWAQAAQQIDPKHQKDIERDAALGKEYTKEVLKAFKPSTNKEFQDRVERIGNSLAAVANVTQAKSLWGDKRLSPFEYHFMVLSDKDVNAFSLPGGYVYVDEGLINFTESDDELAGVLAHEIAHCAFRHVWALQREENKLQIAQIPLIIAAILVGSRNAGSGGAILQGGSAAGQSMMSSWSVKAEKAADYGGMQYMIKSSYNPVGMLTMMERLAIQEKTQFEGLYDLGIYRTHPPGAERAQSLTKYLQQAGIAIRRSEVTTSFRATAKPAADGAIEIDFGKRKLVSFRGVEATQRATESVKRLNAFFDKVPQLYEVRSTLDGSIIGLGQTLLTVQPQDTELHQTPADTAASAVKVMKDSLYMLAYRIWDRGSSAKLPNSGN